MSESMDGREVFVSSCDISPYSSWKKTSNTQIQIHFKTLLTLLEDDLPDKFTLRYKE